MTVKGHCDPAFSAVRAAFERNFAAGKEVGAAVAVYRGDRLVVDLWGGLADRRSGREWEEDTPCFSFSCTKAMTAIAAALLAERGLYDVDGPVTEWWPEYGVAGKEATTAAHLLSHQAGLPALGRPVTAEEAADPKAMAAELAAQAPEWVPGTAHGYHAMTYGWLAGEIVRRLSGRTVGDFVREEFASDLDLWIGAPDDVIERAARLTGVKPPPPSAEATVKSPASSAETSVKSPASSAEPTAEDAARADSVAEVGRVSERTLHRLTTAFLDPESLLNRALNNPAPGKGGFNNPVVLRGGWPAAGMTSTARSMATVYRRLLAGEIVRPETLRAAIRRRVEGPDLTLLVDSSFGLGFMRPSGSYLVPKGARETAFGHTGAGGAIGLGDLENDLTLAYTPNGMGREVSGDFRAYSLVKAAFDSLG